MHWRHFTLSRLTTVSLFKWLPTGKEPLKLEENSRLTLKWPVSPGEHSTDDGGDEFNPLSKVETQNHFSVAFLFILGGPVKWADLIHISTVDYWAHKSYGFCAGIPPSGSRERCAVVLGHSGKPWKACKIFIYGAQFVNNLNATGPLGNWPILFGPESCYEPFERSADDADAATVLGLF